MSAAHWDEAVAAIRWAHDNEDVEHHRIDILSEGVKTHRWVRILSANEPMQVAEFDITVMANGDVDALIKGPGGYQAFVNPTVRDLVDALVGLKLLPVRFSRAYRLGYADGKVARP